MTPRCPFLTRPLLTEAPCAPLWLTSSTGGNLREKCLLQWLVRRFVRHRGEKFTFLCHAFCKNISHVHSNLSSFSICEQHTHANVTETIQASLALINKKKMTPHTRIILKLMHSPGTSYLLAFRPPQWQSCWHVPGECSHVFQSSWGEEALQTK